MSSNRKSDTIERELGINIDAESTRTRAIAPRDITSTARDLQRHASDLVDNAVGPDGVIGTVLDHFFPDPVRREQRKGNLRMAQVEIGARVQIHESVKEAQVKQVKVLATAFGVACELEAEEEIGRRAIETAKILDEEISRSGAEFDRRLDAEIAQRTELKSDVAKLALGRRLQRRMEAREEIEDAILQSVSNAVRGAGRQS
jgi:hypothetical protein